jgi:DNA segregation ATPase FtsK/SpoIIIE, S-DNA-T family
MVTTSLAVRVHARECLPRLVKVSATSSVHRVTVRMLPGQVVEDYAEIADRLAQTVGAAECRVRTDPKHRDRGVLWFLVKDPLTERVAPAPPAEPPDPASLPVARREDGPTYRLRLLGSHLLVVGATGSGKGSVLWSIVAALSTGVASGVVLDPKDGMDLAGGRPLFARFCHTAASSHTAAGRPQPVGCGQAGHRPLEGHTGRSRRRSAGPAGGIACRVCDPCRS